ncbi:GNAT family N-acetyltransferase [Shimia ponticola]|uniref:GNAT family N-acetyltransferase n=1 Tax=Shimia ponticola TaxID=2582893 RepID=UPI0011BF9C95|nr:GNAT family N-acetyltransferase [Shimia ponticola]
MIVRLAGEADLTSVADIWNDVIRNTLQTFTTAEKTVAGLRDIDPIYVTEVDGAVVGFACYFPFRSGPGYARTIEHSIYLAPEAQGRGAGRALMHAIEDHARAEGHHVLISGMSAANPGGIAFHEKMGFEVMGRLSEVGYKNGQYIDLVLAQKILS